MAEFGYRNATQLAEKAKQSSRVTVSPKNLSAVRPNASRLGQVGGGGLRYSRRLRADPKCQNDPIGATKIPGTFSRESNPTLDAGWIPVRMNKGRPGSQPNLPRCLKDLGLEPHV